MQIVINRSRHPERSEGSPYAGTIPFIQHASYINNITNSTERGERVARQRQPDSWELGFSWGQGVLRTLERGAESNDGNNNRVFHHENHPSVWGLQIGRMYGLTGHWSLGWELGYKDLGKTSGFYDRFTRAAGQRFSDRLLSIHFNV